MIVSVAITVKLREIAANTVGVIHEVSNFNTACCLMSEYVLSVCTRFGGMIESCIIYIYIYIYMAMIFPHVPHELWI